MERAENAEREDRKALLKALMLEDRNPQGAWHLIKEARLSEAEVTFLIEEVLQEASQRNLLEKRQFDIKTMRYLSLKEWIGCYFGRSTSKGSS
ncbi:MAG: hypothetical protein N3G78_09340 [Desulfobacterota bacterium]|nr:hypothetical protein [Thermodesulfobacteriota bacterium]